MSASSRYGQLVRGWDWRTTPERLAAMQRCVDAMKVGKTTMLEFAIDYLLKSQTNIVLIDDGASLVTWRDAEPTERKLGDSLENEGYVEWLAPAYSAMGEAYNVRWLHKDDGREPEHYDWQNIHEVQRDYDGDISTS